MQYEEEYCFAAATHTPLSLFRLYKQATSNRQTKHAAIIKGANWCPALTHSRGQAKENEGDKSQLTRFACVKEICFGRSMHHVPRLCHKACPKRPESVSFGCKEPTPRSSDIWSHMVQTWISGAPSPATPPQLITPEPCEGSLIT